MHIEVYDGLEGSKARHKASYLMPRPESSPLVWGGQAEGLFGALLAAAACHEQGSDARTHMRRGRVCHETHEHELLGANTCTIHAAIER